MNCGKRDTVINGTAQLEGELVAGEYNWCRGADGEFKNIKAGWCALRSASCQDVGDAGGGGKPCRQPPLCRSRRW
jgi:hypothetical protein